MWSYPNVHGDVMTTANATGVKQGSTLLYDSYGQALGTVPDNSAGSLDYGWLGQHQRPLEHEGTLATIEMGARQYVPGLGRFIEVDPLEGGSANDYDYSDADPVNKTDLDGRCVVLAGADTLVCGAIFVAGSVAIYGAIRWTIAHPPRLPNISLPRINFFSRHNEGHRKETPSQREKHEDAKRREQRLKEKKRQQDDWQQKPPSGRRRRR